VNKTFDDFLSTISDNDIEKIQKSTNEFLKDVHSVPSTKASLRGNEMFVVSYSISIELLRRYHDWLHE
jgi:hypothetical protein